MGTYQTFRDVLKIAVLICFPVHAMAGHSEHLDRQVGFYHTF